jgi:hypothetical protein
VAATGIILVVVIRIVAVAPVVIRGAIAVTIIVVIVVRVTATAREVGEAAFEIYLDGDDHRYGLDRINRTCHGTGWHGGGSHGLGGN